MKKRVICVFLLFSMVVSLMNKPVDAKSKTVVYSVSAVGVKTFRKTGSKLKVVTMKDNAFFKGNRQLNKNKMTFKISKKCKWIHVIEGIRNPDKAGTFKSSYKEIKEWVDQMRDNPENGYYTLGFYVKNKKLVKVVLSAL